MVLSLNFYMVFFREDKAIPKSGDLKERKSDQWWTLVIGPRSFTANHSNSSFYQVCGFCAGTGLLAFELGEYRSGCNTSNKVHVVPLENLV